MWEFYITYFLTTLQMSCNADDALIEHVKVFHEISC